MLVRWGGPAWVCCDESSGSGNISHQHVTTDNFDDVDHHCAGHCAHCIMTQQCHGWGRGLFSSAAATVTLYYVIKTPLISNPQRQHPFDNISRCQVFCKNLKLAALPMCWLCLLQISKIWKNTAVCGPLWSAVAAIHRWMVSTNSSALPPMTIVLDPGMAAVCFHCNLFRFGIFATDHGVRNQTRVL